MKDIESEKERERGGCIICMFLDVTTTLDKQGPAFCEKNHDGENHVELANLLSRHNIEMDHRMKNQIKPNVTSYLSVIAKIN